MNSESAPAGRIGVDTGGTFTDFVWLEDGQLRVHKQLSSGDDPSRTIISGLQQVRSLPDAHIVHGSTVATNAILERRGARTALITTAGFRDVLALGRQNRPDLYALVPQKPPELVPRKWRFEVAERISAQGNVLRELDLSELDSILVELREEHIESVAVCLLFSFLQPAHEREVRRYLLESLSGEQSVLQHISISSEVLPEYREYERTATTVINAYVAPVMARYLKRLAAAVSPRTLVIMQSNGGVISADVAATQAARTVLSGPAGGVVGAQRTAQASGFDNIITFDMGGTSTDVALCPGTLPATSRGEIAGFPLRLPILDIHTVGAGGGSLAAIDAGGALHVGPQSAGADPGPICYGLARTGSANNLGSADENWYVTTTDANLVLGRLDAEHFLGGRMVLDEPAALHALTELARKIAAPSPQAAAWDVVRVANATMERAIRRISVERGFDPRDFTLVAFGGAGPLHGCDLAQSMGVPRVLIPPAPGVLSALGMLLADPTRDYSQTVLRLVDSESLQWLEDAFEPLYARAVADMAGEGFSKEQLQFKPALDMRYAGQSHELTVAYSPRQPHLVSESFHGAHERRYGYRQEAAAVEVVTVRLSVIGAGASDSMAQPTSTPENDEPVRAIGKKIVWFDGQGVETALYERDELKSGQRLSGPAIIFQYDSTTVVPPRWQVDVHETGGLILSQQVTAG